MDTLLHFNIDTMQKVSLMYQQRKNQSYNHVQHCYSSNYNQLLTIIVFHHYCNFHCFPTLIHCTTALYQYRKYSNDTIIILILIDTT